MTSNDPTDGIRVDDPPPPKGTRAQFPLIDALFDAARQHRGTWVSTPVDLAEYQQAAYTAANRARRLRRDREPVTAVSRKNVRQTSGEVRPMIYVRWDHRDEEERDRAPVA